MLNNVIRSLIISSILVKTYCNLIAPIHNNNNFGIIYWTVGPKYYICMCNPNSVLVKNPKLNATIWDTYCSNQKQCVWNEDEIIIKTWYQSD